MTNLSKPLYKRGRSASETIMAYSMPEPNSGCWIWLGAANRYGMTRYRGIQFRAHRLSWLTFRGSIPGGLGVLHKCDNSLCVNPDHLFLGTQRDNIHDMIKKGRSGNGEHHPHTRLTREDVLYIRSSDERTSLLSKKFNVSMSNINAIKRKVRWSNV